MGANNKLPNEYRKRSLVTIEMDSFQAMIFVPGKLKSQQEANPGKHLVDSVAIEENYIVVTHRLDGNWDYTINHDGVETRLPGLVVDRINSHRAAIIKEGRKASGEESARKRLAKVSASDQAAGLDADDVFRSLNG